MKKKIIDKEQKIKNKDEAKAKENIQHPKKKKIIEKDPIFGLFHSLLFFCFFALLLLIPVYHFFIPNLLNYPTNAYNSGRFSKYLFLKQSDYLVSLFLIGMFAVVLIIRLNLNKLIKYKKYLKAKKIPEKELMNIHLYLYKLPLRIFYSLVSVFSVFIFLLHSIETKYIGFNSIKLLLLIFSFLPLVTGFIALYTKKLIYNILNQLPNTIEFPKNKKNQSNIFVLIFFNFLFMSLSFIIIVCFSQFIQVSRKYLSNYYKEKIQNQINISRPSTYDDLINVAKSIEISPNDSVFIITPENKPLFMNGNSFPFPQFALDYINTYTNQNNLFYINFASSKFGTYVNYPINNSNYKIAIIHNINEDKIFSYFISVELIILVLTCSVWHYYCYLYTRRIKEVLNSFEKLSEKNHVPSKDIKILSTDEFGQLCYYFNKLRIINLKNNEIQQQNQEYYLQKEQFTSLGHLVGGISHNLKTPIMSLSGASEGLTDLIKEYDMSIDDDSVTKQDHHDIAKEMNEWNDKIKNYLSYMSDVITAVKDQTATVPDELYTSFTIDEFLKRLLLIIKYDLTVNSINFVNNVLVNLSFSIEGNINSLIQVVEAIITNSIEAYDTNCPEKEKIIEFTTLIKNKNLIFSIKDYAGGIPTSVQNKIFKEMITSKGRDGTGLGLYVANSNIKANFNGAITFTTAENIGTTFNIIIPIKN